MAADSRNRAFLIADFRKMKIRIAHYGYFPKTLLFLAAAIVLTTAGGCRAKSESKMPAGARIITDDLGREVAIPENVERVISLAPSTTEMIFAAGGGDRLVGVTTYCNYPAEALAIQKVGDTQTPNIETITALRPQIVFVSTSSQLEAFTEIMRQQNAAVFVTNPANFDGVVSNLRQFGEIFGTQPIVENLIAGLTKRLERIDQMTAGYPPVRVFVQISDSPLFTIGKQSFLTETIKRAGGISVTSDIESAYTIISKETAAALNPDAIVLSESSDNNQPNAVFANSEAVRGGRVYRVNADLLSRPGPRLLDAMEQIASDLHGEDPQ